MKPGVTIPVKNVSEQQVKDIHQMTSLVDATISISPFIKETVEKFFPNKKNYFIHEPVNLNIFNLEKQGSSTPPNFIFCSTVNKCFHLLEIKSVLEFWQNKLNNELYIISDADPQLDLDYSFIPLISDKACSQNLLKGDIFLAPRKINSYDLGHSISKISQPMAKGIPVIASPLSSYKESPALIAENVDEWNKAVGYLLNNKNWLTQSKIQRDWVGKNCSIEVCGNKLIDVLKELI
jgi:hypothetical protein